MKKQMDIREAVKNVLTDTKKPLADRGGTPPPLTDNPKKI